MSERNEGEPIPGGATAPDGFRASGVACGIKPEGLDLAIIGADDRCTAAAMYTTNRIQAAPLRLTRTHLADGRAQAIVVNSGNANCATGLEGEIHAQRMAEATGEALGIEATDVVVASTGVIGRSLPIKKIERGIERTVTALSSDGGETAARAMMTTDTHPKTAARRVETKDGTFTVGGMAKGAGMIAPNLATMLVFLTTDAQAEAAVLKPALKRAVSRSFNAITVDGDQSTNDMVVLLASGASGVDVSDGGHAEAFSGALDTVTLKLAQMLARDGEGATKLVTVQVDNASTQEPARQVAQAIANSPLCKTAVFGRDPNWGRVLVAAGNAGVPIDVGRLTVEVGGIPLFKGGAPTGREAAAQEAMGRNEVTIRVDMGTGEAAFTYYTCDLTYDYVRINAEYTT